VPTCDASSIFQDNVKGVNDARNPAKDGQKDVDPEVCIAASFKEHTERWYEDGNKDLADIGCGKSHCYNIRLL